MLKKVSKKLLILGIFILVGLITVGVITGINHFKKVTVLTDENYLASHFIELGVYKKGRTLAQQALEISTNDISKQLIVLSFCYEKDYEKAISYGNRYLKSSEDTLLNELITYAQKSQEDNAEPAILIKFHNQIKQALKMGDKKQETIEVAATLLNEDPVYYDYRKVEESMQDLVGAKDTTSLKAKAYGSTLLGRPEEALEYVKELVNQADSLPNRIALSNALVAVGDLIPSEKDEQTQKIEEKIKEIENEITELSMQLAQSDTTQRKKGEIQKKIENKEEEAIEYYEQKRTIPIQRALNYLQATTTPFSKKIGYRLQVAHLTYLLGKEEQASSIVKEIFEEVSKQESSQYLAPQVQDMIGAYDYVVSYEELEEDNLPIQIDLDTAVSNVMEALTQGFSVQRDYYINENQENLSFDTFLMETLQEYKGMIQISHVVAKNYPEIDVHITTLLSEREADAFTKKHFQVIDEGITISDFELFKNSQNQDELAVSLVIDASGSMNGEFMENAKRAALNFLANADGRLKVGLVKFENRGQEVVPLTESTGMVARGIDTLQANGGTNIADGLRVGIANLSRASGSKAIILLSDGQDGDTSAIEEVKRQLKANGVKVYSIGMGNADPAYLQSIAVSTGGTYMQAVDSVALGAIYSQIQQYIFNDYVIRFNVKENIESYDRNVHITLQDEAYDEQDYKVGVSEEEIIAENTGILTNFYEQIGGSRKGGQANE